MLGTDDMKIKYTSATSISVTATIKNFSKNTYKRIVAAYIYDYAENNWLTNASKTMNLSHQKSEEVTFNLQGMQDDKTYCVALYYFEDSSSH